MTKKVLRKDKKTAKTEKTSGSTRSSSLREKSLTGTWYRAGEEETATEKVYRSLKTGEAVPRGRNREILELKPDGTLIEGGIAPTDARTEQKGEWKVEGEKLNLSSADSSRTLKIVSVDSDRLVISK